MSRTRRQEMRREGNEVRGGIGGVKEREGKKICMEEENE